MARMREITLELCGGGPGDGQVFRSPPCSAVALVVHADGTSTIIADADDDAIFRDFTNDVIYVYVSTNQVVERASRELHGHVAHFSYRKYHLYRLARFFRPHKWFRAVPGVG